MQEDNKWQTKLLDWLRWSEKYTKTDMVYLSKGGFWLTLGRIVYSGSGFLLAIAFANLVSPEIYGTYKYALSIVGFLVIPTLTGMGQSIVRSVAQGHEGSFILAIKTKIIWGITGALGSLAVAAYYWWQGSATLAIIFAMASLFIPFMDSLAEFQSYLIGKKLFDKSTVLGIYIKIAALVFLGLTLFFFKNLIIILLVYFLTYTLARLAAYIYTLKKFPPNKEVSTDTIGYGKHLSLMNIINNIAAHVDKIIVFQLLGPVQLAIYSFAIAAPEQVKGLLSSLNNLLMPKFAAGEDKKIIAGMNNKILRLFIVILIIIGLYVLTAPFIYKIFFPQYTESILLSQIFALGMLNFALIPTSTYLKAKKYIKAQYIIKTASPIIQIILMVSFVYFYGLMGLVIARVLTRYISSLIGYLLYRRATSQILVDTNMNQ